MGVLNLPPQLMAALAAKAQMGGGGPPPSVMGGAPMGMAPPNPQPSVLMPQQAAFPVKGKLSVAKPKRGHIKMSPLVAKAFKAKAKRAGMGG